METSTIFNWTVALIFAVLYWRIRIMYYNYLELNFKYKLFKLRDKLRLDVIKENISENDWFFDYLDTSICIAVKEISALNLYSLIFITIRNKNNHVFVQFNESLNAKLENHVHSKILFDEYGDILVDYVLKKHYVLSSLANLLVKLLNAFSAIDKRYLAMKTSIANLRTFPETSASSLFVYN